MLLSRTIPITRQTIHAVHQSAGYHTARAKVAVMANGKVAEQVDVELAIEPANAVQVIVWSTPVSEDRYNFTTVPIGTLEAAMLIDTDVFVLIIRSGTVKLPVGLAGTGTPLTLTSRTDGNVVGNGVLNGAPNEAAPVTVPVNEFVVASIRIRPTDPPVDPLFARISPLPARVCA